MENVTIGHDRLSWSARSALLATVLGVGVALGPTGATAAPCIPKDAGDLSLYLAQGCEVPPDTEEKVFFDAAVGVKSFTGNVGSEDGVEVQFTSDVDVKAGNGFATVKPSTKGDRIGEFTISTEGATFTDVMFDIKLAKFQKTNVFPFMVEAFNGDQSLGIVDYAINELKAKANLSFMLLANVGEMTSIVLTSLHEGKGGLKQIRHVQLSGVEETGVNPDPVPLPPAFMLLAGGLLGMVMLGRGRKSRTQ